MTKTEAKSKIQELIAAAQDDFDYGGSEDDEGVLHAGYVNFGKLEADIFAVVDALADSPNEPV